MSRPGMHPPGNYKFEHLVLRRKIKSLNYDDCHHFIFAIWNESEGKFF